MAPSTKRRKTGGAEMKPNSNIERKPLPVTILSGFLVCGSYSYSRSDTDKTREVEKQPYSATSYSHQTMASALPSLSMTWHP
jgi:hypothetical protein